MHISISGRKRFRLEGYDYSKAGVYHLTFCTQNRLCLFGDVIDGIMRPNDVGKMIVSWWLELERKFPTVTLDVSQIMPNHFHGVIGIQNVFIPEGDDLCVVPFENGVVSFGNRIIPIEKNIGDFEIVSQSERTLDGRTHRSSPTSTSTSTSTSIPRIMQWFKTMTTNEYIRNVFKYGWTEFERKLWQRSYHDNIIRNEAELQNVREYIRSNPMRWGEKNSATHSPANYANMTASQHTES